MISQSALKRPVLWETWVFALLCVADTAATVVLIKLGIATEANPVLLPFLHAGIPQFVMAKTALFVPALIGLELLRSIRPDFVRLALRAGIVGYVLVYVVGSLCVHLLR